MACQVQPVLDGEGDAGQRPECLAGGTGPVSGVSGGPDLVGRHQHDSVQPGVHLVDAFQMGLNHLAG